MIDERAICGARNNADWYETMFTVHGLKYSRKSYAFLAEDVPPPYYSQLTVLSPDKEATVISELALLAERSKGVLGLKDSFCQLDLVKNGFRTLFEASWIWRSPLRTSIPAGWEIVSHADDLSSWEDAWKRNGSPTSRRMFPDVFLTRNDVVFLGQKAQGRFIAGCIANRSDDCIGLSNVFAEVPSEKMFSQAAGAVAATCDSLPIVGYESGEDLEYAMKANFSRVGDLRILLSEDAKF